MRKYLTEFIGTFFIVLTAVMVTSNPDTASMAPLAVAGMYLAMVYAGTQVSGGHFNPAITMAALMRRKVERGDAMYYVLIQLVASVVAAAIGVYLHDCNNGASIVARVNEQPICAVLAEFFGTFALVFVMLQVSSIQDGAGNTQLGMAAGFTVLAAGLALGNLSGGAFNPAIALGASVAGLFGWDDILVYLIGNTLGAAAAATAFQFTFESED